jgi:glycosyltransferase involved in cell wall biosynthesis
MTTPETTPVTTPAQTCEIRFSGIVVCFNEASRLRQCLAALSFCDQILLVDLGSTDGCVEIGREMGVEVVQHERVPYGQVAQIAVMPRCRNEWVLGVDPDEVLPARTAEALRAAIAANPDAAMFTMNFQYYFRGKPLRGTRWSLIRKPLGLHKGRAHINTNVHMGFVLNSGFRSLDIPDRGLEMRIQHYWCDTYSQLFEKHNRYLKHEGKARYDNGDRFSWDSALWESLRSIKNNLIKDRGIFCGFDGIFLSFFHAWYVFNSHLSLRRYEREVPAGGAPVRS